MQSPRYQLVAITPARTVVLLECDDERALASLRERLSDDKTTRFGVRPKVSR